MARNIENLQKCPNGYNESNILNNFYVKESESKICDKCSNFSFDSTTGLATCKLLTNITESFSDNSGGVFMEGNEICK